MTPVALTIAGSDSGGGAGVQADLRTFAFHCVHGASALTCVTAQNTMDVTKVAAIDLSMILAQIDTVTEDFQVNAVKTGMLLNREIITAVAQKIEQANFSRLVVDPVMVSRSGVQLIDNEAILSLKQLLLPKALIITPNRYEAEILSGLKIDSFEALQQAAIAIYQQSKPQAILVKGGGIHGEQKATDVWFDGTEIKLLQEQIVETQNTHGTGCTLSAAICANLALGKDLWSAVVLAKKYVTKALENSLNLGAGNGPVGHFFPLLNQS